LKRATYGFTIVELITVMVILGVLSAIAIPRLMGNNAFAGVTYRQTVVAALRHAQKTAVSHRRMVCASITATTVTLRIASQPNGPCDLALTSPDGSAYASTSSGIVAGGTLLSNGLFFLPDGQISDNSAGTGNVSGAISITGESGITVNGSTGYVE
jgi:MSHA pilin protein MshC